MEKISMVIPTYTLNEELELMAHKCALSYRDQVDELIITEDGGKFSFLLMGIADVYIFNKKNNGFTKNVNIGWRRATGDFVMIVNSDTSLKEGNIRELCQEGKVTSPEILNQPIPRLAGPFFVVPKEVEKERGMLIEELKTYFSDTEYDARVADIFQKGSGVKIYHEMAKTVSASGMEGGEESRRDKEIYANLIKEGKAKEL